MKKTDEQIKLTANEKSEGMFDDREDIKKMPYQWDFEDGYNEAIKDLTTKHKKAR